MISVHDVEKHYGSTKAVSNLSFDVQAGEIVGLLGHNGAGKTTMMKMLTGYLEPTKGQISIDGLDLFTHRIQVQKKIGYLPENAPLYLEMQVQEYLDFIAQLRGLKGSKKKEAIQEALESTGLEDRRFQVIQTLSKGYRQRVGLAQAILHKPKILILDEPTNGLDPVQILEIRDLIRRLAQETTILVSTHILSEIEAVCDRVIILIDGYLVEDQPLSVLLGQGALHLAIRPKNQDGSKVDLSTDSIQNKASTLLNQVEGLESIKALGEENGFLCYQIQVSAQWDTHAQLVNHVIEHQWEIGQMNHEVKSLEGVFRDLMAEHIKNQKTPSSAVNTSVNA